VCARLRGEHVGVILVTQDHREAASWHGAVKEARAPKLSLNGGADADQW
jgi:hypothetical protein